MKRRNRHATTEKAGLIAVTDACNRLNLIWRDLLQEDVGVDGTIEIVIDNFPTGKLVGGQVKSGSSYIRNENEESFRIYPDPDDLQYWRSLTLPLFLFVHDPRNSSTYWLNVQQYLEGHSEEAFNQASLEIPKANLMGHSFREHLEALFDLVRYDDARYEDIMNELLATRFVGGFPGAVSVTALDLFVRGLWGLCSKVQFHLSLLTEEIRNQLAERPEPSQIGYDLSRATLFPYLTRYFNILTRHHLALIDVAELNETLYGRLEWPAVIAPLSLNGRRFVDFLRHRLADEREVRDNQNLSFSLYPHVQIETFESFTSEASSPFGRCTDVLIVQFNKYLDYYHLLHLVRYPDGVVKAVASQNIFYYELLDYLESRLNRVSKDQVVCRYQDTPISPLICWLEKFLDMTQPVPSDHFSGLFPSEQAAMNEGLLAMMAPIGALTVSEQRFPDARFLQLTNGELLFGHLGDRD